jgi:crotonobetainyl-CoA:carnitine CoA-transferase CaiB-like acyl-CoA transferase
MEDDKLKLPLSGLKVLDLTRALSGPFSTMILADLGAEVVKIESTPAGDLVREWDPFDRGISAYYLSANRNKRGVAIDFRNKEGLALIRKMALRSDIVVENFKVGTMDKMGLGYRELAAEKPELIMASISGYGSKGPAKNWAGFDQIAQGYSGFMSLTGTSETGPIRVGTAIGDLTSGMWLTIGILAAVIEQKACGKGQHIEASLLASLVSLLSVQGQRYLSLGDIPVPCGNAHAVISPYGTFETADGPLNLAPATQAMWQTLCTILGLERLVTDSRFLTNTDRVRNRDVLKEELETSLRHKTRAEWTQAMVKNGIPAGPINQLDDVFGDPQVLACKLVETVQHPVLGELKLVGLPLSMSHQEDGTSVRTAPPLFGQDTIQVFSDYGFDQHEIDRLIEQKIIFQASDPG